MVGLVLYLGVAAVAWKKGVPRRPLFFLLCVNTIINNSTNVYKIRAYSSGREEKTPSTKSIIPFL